MLNYQGDFISSPTRFFTMAVYEWLVHDGITLDEVIVMLTAEAERMNWEDVYPETVIF